jgi:hypothetical protein
VPTLYVICPSESYFPGVESWIVEAWAMLPSEHQEVGWVYDLSRADGSNTFPPLIVYSKVAKSVGPVLILGAIKQAPITVLTTKLVTKCVICHVKNLMHADSVREAIVEILNRHQKGEPYVPIRLAATLQILWKLQKGKYWGGSAKNKAFIWASDLPKGRGITDAIAPHVLMVANELTLKGLLKSKTSQGDLKYALNRDFLPTMHAIFRSDWERVPTGLQSWLMNGEVSLPRSEIDLAVEGWDFGAHTGDS